MPKDLQQNFLIILQLEESERKQQALHSNQQLNLEDMN